MRWLAKLAPSAMRSRISVTQRDEMPDSRSGASRRSYSQSSASAAANVMRQSLFLSSNVDGSRLTMKSPSWFENHGPTSSRRFRRSELREKQRARLTPDEEKALVRTRNTQVPPTLSVASSSSSLDYAKDHIFERVSVAQDHELLTEALRHGRGRIRLGELKGELSVQESAGRVLRSGREIATETSLEREQEMIATVNRGLGGFEPLVGAHTFVISDRLRPEQKHAVEFVLRSCDLAVSISGAAGTGKTATLKELRRGLMEAGRTVLAVAPTMSAVEELQKVGFADAITVERLLQDPSIRGGIRGKVIILDEAGMVSARQMANLLRMAEECSLRVVFSGDTKQIRSVEAGDALRILEKESRLKTVTLTQVQRQSRKDYRTAMEELRQNPERGFAKLDAMGAVREVAFSDRAAAIADAYAGAAGQTLVVCATHDEIDRVTEAIRERRKASRQLGTGMPLTRHVSLNWTAAQKADLQNYRPGQLLGFHRAVRSIAKARDCGGLGCSAKRYRGSFCGRKEIHYL